MANTSIVRGKTLPNSGLKNDLHELIDLSTVSISNIVNADINASAAIAWSKLASSDDINSSGQVTDLTITSEVEDDTLYFDSTNWVRQANGRDGRLISFNSSANSSLSATSAANSWADSGVTAITFTPAAATNIITVSWGFVGQHSSSQRNFDATLNIDSADNDLYMRSCRQSGAANRNQGLGGSAIIQLSAASHTFEVSFKNTEASGTVTAKEAYIYITEQHYSS